ncbi:MAG: hypothetical protein AAF585_24745, partial [Verrucomicrobiota bacterium]
MRFSSATRTATTLTTAAVFCVFAAAEDTADTGPVSDVEPLQPLSPSTPPLAIFGVEEEPERESQIQIDSPDSGQRNLNRTMSTSGQFLLYGSSRFARGEVAKICEDFKKDFNATLQLPERWQDPIVVQVHEKQKSDARAKRYAFSKASPVDGGGMRYDLGILLTENFQLADLEIELTRILLQQQMFARHRNPKFAAMPPWLLVGAHELIQHRRHGRPSEIYRSITKAHQIIPIRELMTLNPDKITDTVTKKVYRACSAALVKSLAEQGTGSMRLRAFLEDMAVDGSGSDVLLGRHFESMNQDPDALNRWWMLQIAAMSQKSAFEPLDLEETELFLQQALIVRIPVDEKKDELQAANGETRQGGLLGQIGQFRKRQNDEPAAAETESPTVGYQTASLAAFNELAAHPDRHSILAANREQLGRLRERAFPLYRSVINDYDYVIGLIIAG